MKLLAYTKKTADDYAPFWAREEAVDSIELDANDWNAETGEREGRVVWLTLNPDASNAPDFSEGGCFMDWIEQRQTVLEVERNNPGAFRAAWRMLRCLRREGCVTLVVEPGEAALIKVCRLGMGHFIVFRTTVYHAS